MNHWNHSGTNLIQSRILYLLIQPAGGGYVASSKFDGTKLYLTGIETKNENLKTEKVFPDMKAPIFAEWYTGKLRIPKGEMLQYVHMFYQSKFESDLFVLVDNGIILKERVVNNR